MRRGPAKFHQVNVAQPALVSAVMLSFYFSNYGAGGLCLLRIHVAVLVRPLMYIICLYSGRSDHIAAKHIAYSNYILNLKHLTFNDICRGVLKHFQRHQSKSVKIT